MKRKSKGGRKKDQGHEQRRDEMITAKTSKRGRPSGQITHRRRQVLAYLTDCAARGERVTLGRLVRSCGLYDLSAAKRIIRDLRQMQMVR
jgi:hypothetical protein